MCTMIAERVAVEGSGKGAAGWFRVRQANVSFDHPFDAPLEHALNIDFVDEAQGPGARVAVELSVESARALVATIQAVLQQAEAGEYIADAPTRAEGAQNTSKSRPS
jgi:hypothetical protein